MSQGVRAREHVAVIGAGVIGLSTALQALDAGFDVTVYAREVTPHTISDGAGSLWEPFAPGGTPDDLIK